eukprot:PITA_29007
MKFLSFNCQGVASPTKKLALRRLLTSSELDIIFLQETLCPASSLIPTLNSWKPNWTFHALDASKRSGSIAIGFCNKSMELRNAWGGRGFLGIDLFAHSIGSDIRIINVYGPCLDRETFWRTFLDSKLLQADNVILGGDLNFSLGYYESWGHSAQVDSLSDTISTLLEEHQWVDMPPVRIQHTWTNNKSGDHSLARRLDKFLIKEAFLTLHPRIRQWVGSGDPTLYRIGRGFIRKLTDLKRISRYWAHQKRFRDDNTLKEAEQAIAIFEGASYGTFPSQADKEAYTSLVSKRTQILKEREESWRLRSRAIWLAEGDNNTKFYHKYANGRKAINIIWELQNEQGQVITVQQGLARLANEHFKSIYKAPREVNILEIMRLAELFPSFVQQEDSENLMMEVTREELEATIKWFKKDKSPGPDGWTIEFYIAFFDILGDDLLRIVEDCRRSGNIPTTIKSTFVALIPKLDPPTSFNDFRPISLCNCLYKIIAKIIANRLKPILSKHISPEQFTFLQHRQIHEAISIAQELLHTL